MKHLLTGVAIAAALAIAAPLSVEAAPMSPSGHPAAATAHHMAAKARPHRAMHHARSGHMHTASRSGDAATRELNLQELARIRGAAPEPHPMPAPAPHH
ncbi:MAG TPA: hypothetical protein VFX06_02420 [Stellaceae bacterium]|nr:hypothetical protein [Stellaceae bacterium]